MQIRSNILTIQSTPFGITKKGCFLHLEHVDYQYPHYSQFVSSSTGKEKDSETGYYAFGARYYDCDLSGIFLSVDPMADKYPSMSPYSYCAWNPVKFVDPDGQEKIISYNTNSSDKNKRAEERSLTRAAKHYTRNIGVIHLFAHGWVPQGQDRCLGISTYRDDGNIRRLKNAQALHEYLKENSAIYRKNNADGKESKTSILVMHSCQTGEEGAIAQQASQELNLLIIAPSENITSREDQYSGGRTEYKEYVSDNGVWNVYYKGELMESFNGKSKPLFDKPQKIIEKYETMYNERHSQTSGE